MNLAGIGIWALSYEAGRPELWEGIKTAFIENYTSSEEEIPDTTADAIQIFPNPVNERAAITFTVSERTHTTLRVYDTGGMIVASLADRITDPGTYTEFLYAENFSPGIYICILQTGYVRSAVKFAVVESK